MASPPKTIGTRAVVDDRPESPLVAVDLGNPIINSPYHPPQAHFEIGPRGPTGTVLTGRRPSESFVPVPPTRKGKKAGEQVVLDLDVTGERREKNRLINDIRREVELWRARGYPGVTPYSRKLLEYWWKDREEPVLFCQREAAETAIFLAEVAGRHGGADYRTSLDPVNHAHNDGLPRIGLKMATGSGKTVVMAMLIAWQTINKVFNPSDARFAKRFLVMTPGITIRERLRVLQPADEANYYWERNLVPVDLWEAVLQAQVLITNYHAFLLRDAKEIEGVASNTRKLLLAGKLTDPFRETPAGMVSRALRDLGGKGEIVVFNDEAHHCYQSRPVDQPTDEDAEAKKSNENARVWFRGLQAIRKKVGIKSIYDLSATPFYLGGSGYQEGYIFPWVVSDFSLMDAIEAGIVKVPRIPVDDNAAGDQVTYLRLWDHVGTQLPKKKSKKAQSDPHWVPPDVLEGALKSLYRSYRGAFKRWEGELAPLGEPPPVMIVVCPNTIVSKLVFDWIAGGDAERPDGSIIPGAGALPLLSNVEDGVWVRRQRTILIDSAQLESGEVLSADFKAAAVHEISAFKSEYRLRNPGADVDKLTDEDLLREVMNTVGKKDKLGEHVRCVVSVSMLTEGWDANTVSHILGIRRFGSQLLCEQVVGRGLRRRSYAINEQGHFDAEYAEIYGVPFAFIPTDRPTITTTPARPPTVVHALDDRVDLRITFPKLDGYRVEIPDQELRYEFDERSRLHVTPNEVAFWVQTQGVVGAAAEQDLNDLRDARPQQVAFEIARTLLRRHYAALDDAPRPWLFPQLLKVAQRWLNECVILEGDTTVGMLLLGEATNRAAEAVHHSIMVVEGEQEESLQPMLRRFDPEGSTDDVHFPTRKTVIETVKSHVSHVTLDGPKGTNTWEEKVAGLLEAHGSVAAYAKNDHLGFAIPYVHEGRSHDYIPDFLVRLVGDDVVRTLIVEVSGGRKKADMSLAGLSAAKADTARHQWCPAVDNHGGYGRWAYLEIHGMAKAAHELDGAINAMYADTTHPDEPEVHHAAS
jgi:type III restriction enzyme